MKNPLVDSNLDSFLTTPLISK